MKLFFDYKFRFYDQKWMKLDFIVPGSIFLQSYCVLDNVDGIKAKKSQKTLAEIYFFLFQRPCIFILRINLQKLSSAVWKYSHDKSAIPPFTNKHNSLSTSVSTRPSLNHQYAVCIEIVKKLGNHNLNRCIRIVKNLGD